MNAREARKISEKTDRLDVINRKIEKAAHSGLFSCNSPFILSNDEQKYLEELGYKITAWGGVLSINW